LRDVHGARDVRRGRHAEPLRLYEEDMRCRRSQVRDRIGRLRWDDAVWELRDGGELHGQRLRVLERLQDLWVAVHPGWRVLYGRRLHGRADLREPGVLLSFVHAAVRQPVHPLRLVLHGR
jgi:hypothetical protein